MLEMKVFRADLKPNETKEYIRGHQKVLEAYGVTQITSADLGWTKEPYNYITIAKDEKTGEVLGGGRIQMVGGTQPLPIETAIDSLDPGIFDFVKRKNREGGTGEYCGLWNSKKIAGYGIGSRVLMRIGVAIMSQLKMSTLLAFVSPVTIKGGKRLGFQVVESLGNRGTFYYPKDDLIETALILSDPVQLEYATPFEREKVLNFRDNPKQIQKLRGPKGEIEVKFDLNVNIDNS